MPLPRLRHRPGLVRVGLAAQLHACAIAVTLAGCGDDGDTGESDQVEALRLGRVHVVLEPAIDDPTGEQLQVTARFAFVRGLDEDFVRARIDMPVLAQDYLLATQCSADDQFASAEPDGEGERELVLVDAGDLRLRVGEERVQIPLTLVPDLLPYMSGVEYFYFGEGLPIADTGGGATLRVEADGTQTDEMPPFSVEGTLPSELGLAAGDADVSAMRDPALVFAWRAGGDETITTRITPLIGGEPASDEITCVVRDEGQAALSLVQLRGYRFPHGADAARLTASRVITSTFDAGDFAGSELIVERRETVTIPLR